MDYKAFNSVLHRYDNLYNVTRKIDDKGIIRGANYDKVIETIAQTPDLYEIYIY